MYDTKLISTCIYYLQLRQKCDQSYCLTKFITDSERIKHNPVPIAIKLQSTSFNEIYIFIKAYDLLQYNIFN